MMSEWEHMDEQYRLYPVTICQVRYMGVYERCLWAAFLADPWSVPTDAFEDDMTCAAWWEDHSREVGKGQTPEEALIDLKRVYVAGTIHDFSQYGTSTGT